MIPRPRCECHDVPVCVHQSNYRPDPGWEDRERGWNGHCLIEGCEGYSLIWVIFPEWLDEIKKENAETQAKREASRGPGYSPPDLGALAELLREGRDKAENEARDNFHGCGLRSPR